MSEPYRTDTVLNLCRQMRKSQDFGALPILADALQDAGYDDQAVLDAMRRWRYEGSECRATGAVLVARVYADESAKAVRLLENLARHIGYWQDDPPTYTVEQLVDVGYAGLADGHMHFWSDDGADFFRDHEWRVDEFFEQWSRVTGVETTDEKRRKMLFSCAC